jgi:hypothetical protein
MVHHLISTVISLPLLLYAGHAALAQPGLLNPWKEQWLELWPMLWLMLLTGAAMLTNGVLGLLALRKQVGRSAPPSLTAPACAEKGGGKCTPADPRAHTRGGIAAHCSSVARG